MKRIVVKICAVLLLASLALTLVACSGVVSSYSATMLVRSSGNDFYRVSFGSMRGRLAKKVTHTGDQDGTFLVTASLDEGEVRVYYMTALSDVEQPLFSLEGGESIEGERRGYLTNGEDPQVVIETGEGGARGCKINIEIVH